MRRCKLGEIADICLGKMLDKEKNKGNYQPYLANINVRWGSFDLQNLSLMRFETTEQERYGLKYGDIVMCEGGEPGRCAIWRDELPNMKIQKALHRIRVHSDIDSRYIYYWFLLAGRNHLLDGSFIETTIKHLTGDRLKLIELELPSNSKQKQISDVLEKLDEKIALNNRVNATLEAMAKKLYDYWFVQFDFPDEKGRPYKTSGGKMVYNEKLGREIPAGWEVVPLTAVCKIVDCLHSQKPNQFYESEKFFLLQLENIVPLGLVDIRNKYYVKSADYELWTSKIEIQEGDLLITNAGRVGAFSRVPKGIRAGIGRNITAIRPQQVSAIYFYYYLHSVEYYDGREHSNMLPRATPKNTIEFIICS